MATTSPKGNVDDPDRARKVGSPQTTGTGPLRMMMGKIGATDAHLFVVPELIAHQLSNGERAVALVTIARVTGLALELLEAVGVEAIRWRDPDRRDLVGWRTSTLGRLMLYPTTDAERRVQAELWRVFDGLPLIVANPKRSA